MAYTPTTQLPDLAYFQWSQPDAPKPRLAAPLTATATTLTFTSAPLDYAGAVITKGFIMNIRSASGYTENVYVPAGALSVDGLTATGCVRGVRLEGLDYTTGDADLAIPHLQGEMVSCNVAGVWGSIITSVLRGNSVATGGVQFDIGDGTDNTVTLRWKNASTTIGWLRKNHSTGKVQYSNDGAAWVNIDSVSASNLVQVTANDTTPGYLSDKITAGTGIVKTVLNPGANESLEIEADLTVGAIDDHEIYIPAYMTGGAAPETNIAIWDSVTNGSFRLTLNGTAYNVDGINFNSPAVVSMAEVATRIQTALQTATSSTTTVTWTGTVFLITSTNTTSASQVSVLTTSTGTVGTDISGAGAGTYMDSETGRGTATAAVLDPGADDGKIVKLSDGYVQDGNFNYVFLRNHWTEWLYAPEDAVLGDAITAGDISGNTNLVYQSPTDGKWYKVTSTNATWYYPLGLALEAGSANDTGKRILLKGRYSRAFSAINPTFSDTGGSTTAINSDTGADYARWFTVDNTNAPECVISGAGTLYLGSTGSPTGGVRIDLALEQNMEQVGGGATNRPAALPPTSDGQFTGGILGTTTVAHGSITPAGASTAFDFGSAITISANSRVYLIVSPVSAVAGANIYTTLGGGAFANNGTNDETWFTSSGPTVGTWTLTVTSTSSLGYSVKAYNGTNGGWGLYGSGGWNPVIGEVISSTEIYFDPRRTAYAGGGGAWRGKQTAYVANSLTNVTTNFCPNMVQVTGTTQNIIYSQFTGSITGRNSDGQSNRFRAICASSSGSTFPLNSGTLTSFTVANAQLSPMKTNRDGDSANNLLTQNVLYCVRRERGFYAYPGYPDGTLDGMNGGSTGDPDVAQIQNFVAFQ